jgi:ATPase subunit of ABC transporter with duplicated ATPase domains
MRGHLSQVNFRETDQQKKVGDLSGGERNRLHLAKLIKAGGCVVVGRADD